MASDQTIVLITGANQGIGFEIAKKLGTEHKDYHIIASGRRLEAVEDAAAKLRELGCSAEALVLDQDSDESITQAAETILDKHGRLDVLINNAGISRSASYDDPTKAPLTRSEWMSVFNTNIFGVSVLTEALIPLLEKSQKTKRIVFISSSLGSLASKLSLDYPARKRDYRVYSASKSALNRLALHYAVEREDDPSWKINICAPGYVATNLNNYGGAEPASTGAINACRLATLGPDGETATFTSRHGPVAW